MRRLYLSPPIDEYALREKTRVEFATQLDALPSHQDLVSIAKDKGIDRATVLLDEIFRNRDADFIESVDKIESSPDLQTPVAVGIVPGMLHEQYPDIGAGGDHIVEIAKKFGFQAEQVKTRSQCDIVGNAQRIVDWLRAQKAERIYLASLSVGSLEVRYAYQYLMTDEDKKRIHTWINISGIPNGTILADTLFKSFTGRLYVRFVSLFLGIKFKNLELLQTSHPNWKNPLRINNETRVLNFVPLMLSDHVQYSLLKRFRVLKPFGPNDGLTRSRDTIIEGGHVYPLWGFDHFLPRTSSDLYLASSLPLPPQRGLMDRLELWLKTLFRACIKRAKFTRALSLCLLAAALLLSLRIQPTTTLIEHIDKNSPEFAGIQTFHEEFESGPQVLLITQRTGENEKNCEEFRYLTRLIEMSPGLISYQSNYQALQAVSAPHGFSFKSVQVSPCRTVDAPATNAWQGSLVANNGVTDLRILEFLDSSSAHNFINSFDHTQSQNTSALGMPIQEAEMLTGMQFSVVSNILAIILLLVGFKWIFGTFFSSVLFGGVLMFSILLTAGGMGLFAARLDLLGTCIFIVALIAAIEDFVFLSFLRKDKSLIKALEALLLPSFLTSLTTVIGFASLTLSEVESIRTFGLWTAVIAAFEWITLFLIYPAFAVRYRFLRMWISQIRIWKEPNWLQLSAVKWLALGVFLIPLFYYQDVVIGQNPYRTFAEWHKLRTAARNMQGDFGWNSVGQLLVKKTLPIEERDQIERQLKEDPHVADILSESSVELKSLAGLPAAHLQLARETLEKADDPLNLQGLEDWDRMIVLLRSAETAPLKNLITRTDSICNEGQCQLAGELPGFASYTHNLLDTLIDSFLLSLVLVTFVLLLIFFNIGLSLRQMVSVLAGTLWGPVALFTIILSLGIEINFVTCIILAVAVGLTGDNAILFLTHSRGRKVHQSITQVEGASLQVAFCMALVALAFLASYFEPPQILSLLLVSAFLLSVFGDIFLTRHLLSPRQEASRA